MTRGGGFLQLLQGGDVELAGAGGLHAGYEGLGGGERGGVGDAVADGGAAQLVAVVAGGHAERGVDHERDLAGGDGVHHRACPLVDLAVTSQGTPEARSTAAVPSVARSEKPRRTSSRAMKATARLS